MLKARRIQLGISQAVMAERLNISAHSLSRYENGRRRWPTELLPLVQAMLGLGQGLRQEWFLSWQDHLQWSGWNGWQIEVDPGPTWADTPEDYEDFYRQLQPCRTPPLEFRRLMRSDTSFECCGYAALCEAGAQPRLASPAALHFPHHPLLDGQRGCLGMARRAALLLPSGWLLWPQIHLLLRRTPIRVDLLAARPGGGWAAVEFDGPTHQNSSWDKKRDSLLAIPTLRFGPAEVLEGHFPALLEAKLAGIAGKVLGGRKLGGTGNVGHR